MPAPFHLTEGTFQSHDRSRLYYRFYAKEDALDTMILLHGHGEHIGRYEKFTDHLSALPVNLALYDFRGHGQSGGDQASIDSYEQSIQDIDSFSEMLCGRHAVRFPLIVFGHSNGGLAAVHWAVRNQKKVKGLILSSPCLGIRLPYGAFWLNEIVHFFSPRFVYRHPIYPPHLTHNPKEVENYKKDPLIQRKISAWRLREMILYGDKIEPKTAAALSCPVHILAAGMEKVVSLDKTKRFYEALTVEEKSLKIFDGFYHEIFNELDQNAAFECLKGCLQRIIH